MADLKQFAEQLVNLTVKEVNDLATILKDEYGIEPAAAAVATIAARSMPARYGNGTGSWRAPSATHCADALPGPAAAAAGHGGTAGPAARGCRWR